ncbi:hypothetical protein KIPE111705_02845 [Kibdelosporangium persicum]|uniref:hypothetical protein n=1 Tax=Kibdelosporangium persicum TaxID=2698649 RepID=UPI001566EA76|nr:hypothetical protein [Kibdelosporangium persicum]
MVGRAVTTRGWRLRLVMLIFAIPDHDMLHGDDASKPDGPRYGCGEPDCRESIPEAIYLAERPLVRTCPRHRRRRMTKRIE